ncbi:hypothetical protein NKI59_11955 [Mesorhizobium sp. M0598]|uniref:hypothetical protein n=1 Tax=Mesorhizobium sp. M0598 TaxID=2956968 RepID=UPI00333830A6
MTIAERKAREQMDRENPWRPMNTAKPDGLICELLFNDLAGEFATDGSQYFLDSDRVWFRIDPPKSMGLNAQPINWRPAYARLTPERRAILKQRSTA